MRRGRILVEKFQPELLEWLRERAEVVVVDPWAEPERWEREAPQVDAVISRKGRITRRHMEESRGRLKIVARTGVGVDVSRVDVDAAKEHGIWVTNMPGSNAIAVAELTFAQMISLARHTVAADAAVRANRWPEGVRLVGSELAGKTLGIVGMGNIGTRVALRARAFEMALVVCDPYIPASHVTALGGRWVGLDELFKESDFVTLHCPLNKETRHMVGAAQLALMKKAAFLVNLARGGVVDENALLECLREKRIAGAAIDVMETEPPANDHPLLALGNVLFTPHIGGSSREAQTRGERGAAEEVIRVLQGEEPRNAVIRGTKNKAVGK
ncbi:MAG TPA: hydroxyacid dehydrogenase [Burkholderiales bacterium]|nr:hydroxyacid dehydrogenase [Burkholderiales bacterium]